MQELVCSAHKFTPYQTILSAGALDVCKLLTKRNTHRPYNSTDLMDLCSGEGTAAGHRTVSSLHESVTGLYTSTRYTVREADTLVMGLGATATSTSPPNT